MGRWRASTRLIGWWVAGLLVAGAVAVSLHPELASVRTTEGGVSLPDRGIGAARDGSSTTGAPASSTTVTEARGTAPAGAVSPPSSEARPSTSARSSSPVPTSEPTNQGRPTVVDPNQRAVLDLGYGVVVRAWVSSGMGGWSAATEVTARGGSGVRVEKVELTPGRFGIRASWVPEATARFGEAWIDGGGMLRTRVSTVPYVPLQVLAVGDDGVIDEEPLTVWVHRAPGGLVVTGFSPTTLVPPDASEVQTGPPSSIVLLDDATRTRRIVWVGLNPRDEPFSVAGPNEPYRPSGAMRVGVPVRFDDLVGHVTATLHQDGTVSFAAAPRSGWLLPPSPFDQQLAPGCGVVFHQMQPWANRCFSATVVGGRVTAIGFHDPGKPIPT